MLTDEILTKLFMIELFCQSGPCLCMHLKNGIKLTVLLNLKLTQAFQLAVPWFSNIKFAKINAEWYDDYTHCKLLVLNKYVP